MIKKWLCSVILLALVFSSNAHCSFTIRVPQESDLPAILDLDRTVTYEYFKPLYMQEYAHLPLGQNPDYFLELELKIDETFFPACVRGEAAQTMLIACSTQDNMVAGLIIFNKNNSATLEIYLVLVGAAYRRKGIGKALTLQAINNSSGINSCIVYPIQKAKDTLLFYEALGFKNKGISLVDEINIYGIPHKDMYFCYCLELIQSPA